MREQRPRVGAPLASLRPTREDADPPPSPRAPASPTCVRAVSAGPASRQPCQGLALPPPAALSCPLLPGEGLLVPAWHTRPWGLTESTCGSTGSRKRNPAAGRPHTQRPIQPCGPHLGLWPTSAPGTPQASRATLGAPGPGRSGGPTGPSTPRTDLGVSWGPEQKEKEVPLGPEQIWGFHRVCHCPPYQPSQTDPRGSVSPDWPRFFEDWWHRHPSWGLDRTEPGVLGPSPRGPTWPRIPWES